MEASRVIAFLCLLVMVSSCEQQGTTDESGAEWSSLSSDAET